MYRKILQSAYGQPLGAASAHAVPSFAGRPRNRTSQFPRGGASRWLAAVLFAMAVLAGCTVGPDYKWPAAAVPADWRNGSEERESIANLKWWQLAVASYAYERPFSQNSFFIRGFPGAKASSGNDIQANVDLTFELDVGPCAAGYGGGVGGAFDQRYLDDDGSSKE